jgi:hypothetical protein
VHPHLQDVPGDPQISGDPSQRGTRSGPVQVDGLAPELRRVRLAGHDRESSSRFSGRGRIQRVQDQGSRPVILVEADDPVIGLVGFVPIGMSDVSSCLIERQVQPGAHVTKGDELGYFQFGGSTYCLVFRPGVIGEFALSALPQPHNPEPALVQVCTRLATALTP